MGLTDSVQHIKQREATYLDKVKEYLTRHSNLLRDYGAYFLVCNTIPSRLQILSGHRKRGISEN